MVAVKEISKCFGVKIWGFVDFLNWKMQALWNGGNL